MNKLNLVQSGNERRLKGKKYKNLEESVVITKGGRFTNRCLYFMLYNRTWFYYASSKTGREEVLQGQWLPFFFTRHLAIATVRVIFYLIS